MMCPARSSRGFTLVEVMVVVGILGVLSALTIPRMAGVVKSLQLRNATDAVKNQLLLARVRAVANPSVHCGVHFDVVGKRSFVFFDSPTAGTRYKYDAGTDRLYGRIDSLPKGCTFTIPAVEPIVDNCVVFRGDGSAKTGGSVVVVSATGAARVVNVLSSTGRVKVLIP